MPVIKLTDEEVIELAKQLSPRAKRILLEKIRVDDHVEWEALRCYSRERAQAIFAARGLDWDRMSEDDREAALLRILDES